MPESSKHRVLFLSPVTDFVGGAERSLFDLLKNPKIEPILVTPGPESLLLRRKLWVLNANILLSGEIESIRRPLRVLDAFRIGPEYVRCIKRLARLCLRLNVKLIHSNGMKAHALAIGVKLFYGVPSVIHFRDIPYTRLERFTWRMFSALSSRVIMVSKPCLPDKTHSSKCSVIMNAVTIPSSTTTRPWLRGEPIQDANLVIGFLGRIHKNKGLKELVFWISEARKSGHFCCLKIFGRVGPQEEGYLAEILADADNLGIAERVQYVGWRDDISLAFAEVDIVAVPSVMPDPLPRTVMESMAHGRIVFGYPAGGIPDMIDHGKSGFLVANADDFIHALVALSEPVFRESILYQARIWVEKNVTLRKLHESVYSVYCSIA